MLDDQNASIKTLKQNLENKLREQHTSASLESSREAEFLKHIDMLNNENEDIKQKVK